MKEMTMNNCPTCGRPMPVHDRQLTRVKARILDIIAMRPGISADELASCLYANDINGGPDGGCKTIHVHIHQLNRCLHLAGDQFRVRGGKYIGYHIINVRKG